MLFTLSISVFATEEETPSSDIPSIEELQAFFPNLDLGDDGYIHNAEDYKESEAKCDGVRSNNAINTRANSSLPQSITQADQPTAIYHAINGDDEYWINVYDDNSYIAYGIGDGTSSMGIQGGSSSSGGGVTHWTNRRVFVYLYGYMYNLFYYISYNINTYSQITTIISTTTPVCTWLTVLADGSSTNASASVIGSYITRATQTSTAPATAYGSAKLHQYGIYIGTIKLYIELTGPSPHVYVAESY